LTPEAFLCEVKPDFVHKRDQKLEMVEGPCRSSLVITPADIQDEAPLLLKDASHLAGKAKEPLDIP
jgi:hypothetical protein